MSAALVWTHGWALWGLVILPLALLLLVRPERPRRLLIGTYALWERVVAARGDVPPRWRRHARRILLPLVVATLLILAAAGPRAGQGGRSMHPLVLVLDTSSSMQARTASGQTRWERATARARGLIATVAPGSEVTLLAPPTVALSGTAAEVLSRLADLEPTATTVQLSGAIDLLLEGARVGSECWLISDVEPPFAAVLEAAGVGLDLLGAPAVGVGITSVAVERVGSTLWLAAEVHCTAGDAELTLGTAAGTRAIALPGAGPTRYLLEAIGDQAALAAPLELTVHQPEDPFTADDVAGWRPTVQMALPQGGEPMGPGLAAVAAALAASGWEPAAAPADAECFVGVEPPADRPSIRIARVAERTAIASAGTPTAGTGAPEAVTQSLQQVQLHELAVAPPPHGGEVLLQLDGVPLIARSAATLEFLFDPADTPALLRDASGAFPLLVNWLAEELIPRRGGATGLLDAEASRRALGGVTRHVAARAGGGTPAGRDASALLVMLAAAIAAVCWWRRAG